MELVLPGYRNGQVEKLVRITAGQQQLNRGQHFTPIGVLVLHWWWGRVALLLPWEETALGEDNTLQ